MGRNSAEILEASTNFSEDETFEDELMRIV